MGLDQFILRGKHDREVKILKNGEWQNAEELLYLRKSYWLHNVMVLIGMKKLGLTYDDLNCKFIPVTKEELLEIVDKSKEVVQAKSTFLLYEYFEEESYSDEDFNWTLSEMKEFNVMMSRYLKNNKKTEYWYWSWW